MGREKKETSKSANVCQLRTEFWWAYMHKRTGELSSLPVPHEGMLTRETEDVRLDARYHKKVKCLMLVPYPIEPSKKQEKKGVNKQ